jgi:ABC-2 type transport system permease protein
MSAPPKLVPESPGDAQSPAVPPATRPMYWSVRRELWENRSIYLAPLVVGAVMLFGLLVRTVTLPRRLRAVLALDVAQQRATIEGPYALTAGLMILTAFLVGAFYCLDALYGERRDRSTLFWKSLPVSDLTTVLAKASIPLVVLPLLTFAIVLTTHTITLLVSAAVLQASGLGAAALWVRLPLFRTWLALAYALVAIALWHAPIYAWLLLVSAWARRAPILWAVLPACVIGVFGRIAFNSTYVCSALSQRVVGWLAGAFAGCSAGTQPLTTIAPGRFLSTPGLWVGLALAAAFLVAAVRLRRYRGPI